MDQQKLSIFELFTNAIGLGTINLRPQLPTFDAMVMRLEGLLNIIYLAPLLAVALSPAVTGFPTFEYLFSRSTNHYARAHGYTPALKAFWGLLGTLAMRTYREPGHELIGGLLPPAVFWIVLNRWKVLMGAQTVMLMLNPLAARFAAQNRVMQQAGLVIMRIFPFLEYELLGVGVLSYWMAAPLHYAVHMRAIAWMGWAARVLFEYGGAANYGFFAYWAVRRWGRWGGLGGVAALGVSNGLFVLMVLAGRDYGVVMNMCVRAAVWVWRWYQLVAPSVFLVGCLDVLGWLNTAWWNTLLNIPPPPLHQRSGRQQINYEHRVAAIHRNVLAMWMATQARMLTLADNLVLAALEAAETARFNTLRELPPRPSSATPPPIPPRPVDGVVPVPVPVPAPVPAPVPVPASTAVARVEIAPHPLDEVLQGVAEAAAAAAPAAYTDEAAAAARRAIIRLIVSGYSTRLHPPSHDLEVRMADVPAPSNYPPLQATVPAPPAGAPAWPEGRSGDEGSAEAEDAVSDIAYSPRGPALAPRPPLRNRGIKGNYADLEDEEPEYAFADRMGITGRYFRHPPGPARDVGAPVPELEMDVDAASASEEDSIVPPTPRLSPGAEALDEEELFWQPPGGVVPAAQRVYRGVRPVLVGRRRFRRGRPWARDPALPPLLPGEDDGYEYQTDDSVNTDGLYRDRPRPPEAPGIELNLAQLQWDWTNAGALRHRCERRAYTALEEYAYKQEFLMATLDEFNNCQAAARCAQLNHAIHKRLVLKKLRARTDREYAWNAMEDNYDLPAPARVPPAPRPDSARMTQCSDRNLYTSLNARDTCDAELHRLLDHIQEMSDEGFRAHRVAHARRRAEERAAREIFRDEVRRLRRLREHSPPDYGTPGNMPPLLPAPLPWSEDVPATETELQQERDRRRPRTVTPPSPRVPRGRDGWWTERGRRRDHDADCALLTEHLRYTDYRRPARDRSERRAYRSLPPFINRPSFLNYIYWEVPELAPADFVRPEVWNERVIRMSVLGADLMVER